MHVVVVLVKASTFSTAATSADVSSRKSIFMHLLLVSAVLFKGETLSGWTIRPKQGGNTYIAMHAEKKGQDGRKQVAIFQYTKRFLLSNEHVFVRLMNDFPGDSVRKEKISSKKGE